MSDIKNEKIFVVVPVYKVEPYLERCIDSILNQTLTDFTLVLVDDGSPDNCPAICDKYAAKDSRIHVIHQENGGLSAARNAGIDFAMKHGDPEKDWISFIDSDDYVHPKYLEFLHRAATEADTAVSSCGFTRPETTEIAFDEIRELNYTCISPEEYLCKAITNASLAHGKLYQLYLFREIRYPVRKVYEDDFTTHKLLFPQPQIAVIWTPLYFWYINRESISQAAWSPSRIHKLDALEAQLSFYQKNGYWAAYRTVAESLFQNSVLQYRTVRAMSPRYDDLLGEMKKRKRRATQLYAKEYGIRRAMWQLFDIQIRRPLKYALRSKNLSASLKKKLGKIIRKSK